MTLDEAIDAVEAGHVQRVCSPGKWIVWRDADGVHVKVLA